MYNPIIHAFGSLVRGPSPRPLVITPFVIAGPNSKELGAVVGYRDDNGGFVEIANHKLDHSEEVHFAEWIEQARDWLESISRRATA